MAHRAMLVGALTTAMFAGAWNVAQSQNEPTPAYPQADKHKPSTLPDRVMLTWEGNPADSQSVTWRTDATVKTAQARVTDPAPGARHVGPHLETQRLHVRGVRRRVVAQPFGYAS